jgi:hypothetical protein
VLDEPTVAMDVESRPAALRTAGVAALARRAYRHDTQRV